jgi:hypothetical protein
MRTEVKGTFNLATAGSSMVQYSREIFTETPIRTIIIPRLKSV